jgi:hypothetical protein
MAFFTDEAAKMEELEVRINALETLTCPQQSVIDSILSRLSALEVGGGTVDLSAVNAAITKLDARLDKIALGAVG